MLAPERHGDTPFPCMGPARPYPGRRLLSPLPQAHLSAHMATGLWKEGSEALGRSKSDLGIMLWEEKFWPDDPLVSWGKLALLRRMEKCKRVIDIPPLGFSHPRSLDGCAPAESTWVVRMVPCQRPLERSFEVPSGFWGWTGMKDPSSVIINSQEAYITELFGALGGSGW